MKTLLTILSASVAFAPLARAADQPILLVAFAGSGSAGFSDGKAESSSFNSPTLLSFAPNGTLYVFDSGNKLVRKISKSAEVTTVPRKFSNAAIANSGLSGLAADSAGGFIALFDGDLLRVSDDGSASVLAIGFSRFSDVAVGRNGVIYVADPQRRQIFSVQRNGASKVLAGSSGTVLSDGEGVLAGFQFPKRITANASGDIYVIDSIDPGVTPTTGMRADSLRAISEAGSVSTLGRWDHGPDFISLVANRTLFALNSYDHSLTVMPPEGVRNATMLTVQALLVGGFAADEQGNAYFSFTAKNVILKATPNIPPMVGPLKLGRTDATLVVRSAAGKRLRVEGSSDLKSWMTLSESTAVTNEISIKILGRPPSQFYRALVLP